MVRLGAAPFSDSERMLPLRLVLDALTLVDAKPMRHSHAPDSGREAVVPASGIANRAVH